jgi:subtilase family serine protease
VVRNSEGRTTLTVLGSASQVERLLHLELRRYLDGGGEFRAPDREPLFEGRLAISVSAIVGLDTAQGWAPHHIVVPDAVGSRPNQPADLQTLYDVGATFKGDGETVAILGSGLPPDPVKDVDAFAQQLLNQPKGLPVGQYTQVLVGGPNRDPAMQAQNEYVENALDVDMVLALAPHAKVIHVLTATNSPGLFTDGISYIVNKLPAAHAVSVSFGTCERGSAGQMPVLNALFAQAKAQGQQWFFAAGDSGTDGCRDGAGNKILSVGWPASSPFVVGVGGEQVSAQGAEQAWGGPNGGGGGGGGGQSESFDKPAFQAGVGPFANDGARDEPDVAALAGPPGVTIIAGGMPNTVEGTSAAAPMWAGMWALIDQARGGKGLPSGLEQLYLLGKAGKGFRDLRAGNNGDGSTPGFAAGPGYDLATGWGAPDVTKLIASWGN